MKGTGDKRPESTKIICQQSTVSRQPSAVNRQPSTVNSQPSTVNRQPSTIPILLTFPTSVVALLQLFCDLNILVLGFR
ncbi:MAG: hypothetical protein KME64_05545 [Scytonematopsis contorta HA4267-MV1]|nr:hypothetical protein [Scytonematopsis contorta HA4267-MV1]